MDANTITIVIAIVLSNLTMMSLMLRQTNRLEDRIGAVDTKLSDKIGAVDTKLSDKIEAVDTKLSAKIEAVDTKLSAKIDRLSVDLGYTNRHVFKIDSRVARLEGFLMKPGRFTLHGLPDDTNEDASAQDAETDSEPPPYRTD